jgi:hypothetical protein
MAVSDIGLSISVVDKGTGKLKEALKLLKDLQNTADSGKKGQLPTGGGGMGRSIPSGARSEASALGSKALAGADKLSALKGGAEKYKALIADLRRGEEFIIESGLKPLKELVKALDRESRSKDADGKTQVDAKLQMAANAARKAIQDYEVKAGDQLSARLQQQQLNAQSGLARLRSVTNKVGIKAEDDNDAVAQLIFGASQRNANLATSFDNSIQSFTEAGGDAISSANFVKDLSTLGTQAAGVLKAETAKSDAELKRIFEDRTKTIGERIALANRAAFGESGMLQEGDIFGAANQQGLAKYAAQATSQELRDLSKKPAEATSATKGLRGATPEEIEKRIEEVEKAYQTRIKRLSDTADTAIARLNSSGSPEAKRAADLLLLERDRLTQALTESLQADKRTLEDKKRAAESKAQPKAKSTSDADRATSDLVKAQEKADREFTKALRRAKSRVTTADAAFTKSFIGGTEQDYADLADRTAAITTDYLRSVTQSLNAPTTGPGGATALPFGGKLGGNFVGDLLSGSGFDSAKTAEEKLAAIAAASAKLPAELKKLGLNSEELAAAQDLLSGSIERLSVIYRPLVKLTDNLNARTMQNVRTRIDVLKAEGKYEEALELLTKVTLRRAGVGTGGKSGTGKRPGRVSSADTNVVPGNMTPDDLRAAGVNSKVADEYRNQQNAIERDQAREERKTSGGQNKKQMTGMQKFQSFASKLGAVAGVFNIITGAVTSAVQSVGQLLEQANNLEKASATVRALSGSTESYTKVLALAGKQQSIFGGSLEENLQGFVSLIPVTKKFGLDLKQVDNVARRLAIVDPLQGFSGAAIALKEFLSGDITSLSRRFEIDRKTLNSIKEAGSKAEQLQKLDEVLTSMGISQEVLSARTATAAAEFDRAFAALSNYSTLLGQGFQQAFGPAASYIADAFGFAGQEVQKNLMLQETAQKITAEFSMSADKARYLNFETIAIVKPANLLEKIMGKTTEYFERMATASPEIAGSIAEAAKNANEYVRTMNKERVANDKTTFAEFGPGQDIMAANFSRISNYISPEKLLKTREITNDMFGNEFDPTQAEGLAAEVEVSLNLNYKLAQSVLNGGGGAFSEAGQQAATDVVRAFTETEIPFSPADINFLNELQLAANKRVGQADFIEAAPVILAENNDLVQDLTERYGEDYVNSLTDAEKVTRIMNESFMQLAEGTKSLTDVTSLFMAVFQEQFKAEVGAYQTQQSYIAKLNDDYISLGKQITDNSYTTQTFNKAVSLTDEYTGKIAEKQTKILALNLTNGNAQTAINSGLGRANALRSGFFEIEGDISVETANVARKIAEASLLQTKITLEGNKSASAIQALGNNFGSFLIDLEEAATLAVEFSDSMAGIATGPLAAGMDLQSQLDFSMAQMRGGVPGLAPQNQGDVFAMGNAQLAIVTQIEQEKLDLAAKGAKNSDDIKDMNKQFFKDQNKALDDHNKDMKELEEDHLKKMEELRRDSEISKRGNEVGFYESLFGMDNLTPDQMAQAGAEYQTIKAEATTLRGQGQFEKAAAVESAGKEGILSKYGDLEEKAQLMLDIKNADEETAELNKEMGEAKDADDKEEIQRKIDKIALEKLKYENEIAQINALETLKKELYEAELNNARTLQESETENYKIEVGKREAAFDEAEKERTRKHGEEVDKRKKAEDAQHKAVISNMKEQMALAAYGQSFEDEVAARAVTGPQQGPAINAALQTRKNALDILNSSDSAASPIIRGMIDAMTTLGGNMVQTANNIAPGALETLNATKDLKTATEGLTTEMLTLNNLLKSATMLTITRFQ